MEGFFLVDNILLAKTASPGLAWLSTFLNFAQVAIGLGFVIFVHELGHFLVAKACGVKCEKFYIGFDFFNIPLGFYTIPSSLVKFQWGETEYGIGSIPLGGYVKMLGQDDNPGNAEEESKRTRTSDGKLDPRSYLAQSVPERMAIISAGVVMNIIFGVIFAAIAYRSGVTEVPAVIGSTTAGDPAWTAGLLPGDRVLQIGKNGSPNEKLRFRKDFMLRLYLSDFGKDVELLVRRENGKEEWFSFQPSERLRKSENPRPTIGIRESSGIKLFALEEDQTPFFPAAFREFHKDDQIVAIDSEPVKDAADIHHILATRPSKAVKFTIARPPSPETLAKNPTAAATEHTVEVPAIPVRDFGVIMEADPIRSVRAGSPAEKAKIKKGDRLVEFNGEPIPDLLTFPQQTLAYIGKTVPIVVERGEKDKTERVELEITLADPQEGAWDVAAGSSIGVETMGIAYNITSRVAKVSGPSADKLEPGDEIVKVRFQPDGEAKLAQEKAFHGSSDAFKDIKVDGAVVGWPALLAIASSQYLPDTKLVATVMRGSKEVTVELTAVESTRSFLEDRNLPLQPLAELHVANSWPDAFSLGVREVKERMSEVVTVLYRLVSRKMSFSGIGGPIGIFRVAGIEASRGLPALLMFFTMLSANLAVMNFLPIPALDGGHMLFLTWEAIFRKPVDENLQVKLSLAGILMLLTLMLFATILDINQLIKVFL